MLRRLQQKWNIKGYQLWLVLLVFALGGSATAYLSRLLLAGLPQNIFWLWKLLLRIGILIFAYPAVLLLIAFIFGQGAFFWAYEKKLLLQLRRRRVVPLSIMNDSKREQKQTFRLAIFASGAGSNAQKIIDHFKNSSLAQVALVVCNKPEAGVVTIAAAENIRVLLIEKDRFFSGDAYLPELQEAKIDLIILAGFLWKVPDALLQAYPQKIINIHPALLPSFGGKGMYGQKVHQAVLGRGDMQTGITIHYVDEHYDNGAVIFQTALPVLPGDTPETLAQRIHQLEHVHYPQVIEKLLNEQATLP